MAPEVAGPLREAEQRRSAAIVGVDSLQFWDFPDSQIRNTAELRARDHIEFSKAVAAVYDSLTEPPRWLFENGPEVTHAEVIDEDCFDRAVASLASHDVYLSVLDPDTPVSEQARHQVHMATRPRPEFGGSRTVGFTLRPPGE